MDSQSAPPLDEPPPELTDAMLPTRPTVAEPEGSWGFERMLERDPRSGNQRGKPLPAEMRARICTLIAEDKLSFPNIAKQMRVSPVTVYKLAEKIRGFTHNGMPTAIPGPKPHGGGRRPLLTESQQLQLVNLAIRFKDRNAHLLAQDLMHLNPGLHVSISTVQRALKQAGVKYMRAPVKDPRSGAGEAHSEELQGFVRHQARMNPFETTFFDETDFVNKATSGSAYGTDTVKPVTQSAKDVGRSLTVYAGLLLRNPGESPIWLSSDARKSLESHGFHTIADAQSASMLLFWYFLPHESRATFSEEKDHNLPMRFHITEHSPGFSPASKNAKKVHFPVYIGTDQDTISSENNCMLTAKHIGSSIAFTKKDPTSRLFSIKVDDIAETRAVFTTKTSWDWIVQHANDNVQSIWVRNVNGNTLTLQVIKANGQEYNVDVENPKYSFVWGEASQMLRNVTRVEYQEGNLLQFFVSAKDDKGLIPVCNERAAKSIVENLIEFGNELRLSEFLSLNDVYHEQDADLNRLRFLAQSIYKFKVEKEALVDPLVKSNWRPDKIGVGVNQKNKTVAFVHFLHQVVTFMRHAYTPPPVNVEESSATIHDFNGPGTEYMLRNIALLTPMQVDLCMLMLTDLRARKLKLHQVGSWGLFRLHAKLTNVEHVNIVERTFKSVVATSGVEPTEWRDDAQHKIGSFSRDDIERIWKALVHLPYTFVWDNARAHGAELTTTRAQSWAHEWVQTHLGINQAIYLPPLSPVFNPVELLFRYTKYHVSQLIRKRRVANVPLVQLKDMINSAFRSVNVSQLIEWLDINCYKVPEVALRASGLGSHLTIPAPGIILNTETKELSSMSRRCQAKYESALPKYYRICIPSANASFKNGMLFRDMGHVSETWFPYLPGYEKSWGDAATLIYMYRKELQPRFQESLNDESLSQSVNPIEDVRRLLLASIDNMLLVCNDLLSRVSSIPVLLGLRNVYSFVFSPSKLTPQNLRDNERLLANVRRLNNTELHDITHDQGNDDAIGVLASLLNIDRDSATFVHAQIGIVDNTPTPTGDDAVSIEQLFGHYSSYARSAHGGLLASFFETAHLRRLHVWRMRLHAVKFARAASIGATDSDDILAACENASLDILRQDASAFVPGDQVRSAFADLSNCFWNKHHVVQLHTVVFAESVDYGMAAKVRHAQRAQSMPTTHRGAADVILYVLELCRRVEKRLDIYENTVLREMEHSQNVPPDEKHHLHEVIRSALRGMQEDTFVRPIDPLEMRRKYMYAQERKASNTMSNRRFAGYDDFEELLQMPGKSLLPVVGTTPMRIRHALQMYSMHEFDTMQHASASTKPTLQPPLFLSTGDVFTLRKVPKSSSSNVLVQSVDKDVPSLNLKLAYPVEKAILEDAINKRFRVVKVNGVLADVEPMDNTRVKLTLVNKVHPKLLFIREQDGKETFDFAARVYSKLDDNRRPVKNVIWEVKVRGDLLHLVYVPADPKVDAPVLMIQTSTPNTRVKRYANGAYNDPTPFCIQLGDGDFKPVYYSYPSGGRRESVSVWTLIRTEGQPPVYVVPHRTKGYRYPLFDHFDFRFFLHALAPTRPRKYQVVWQGRESRLVFDPMELIDAKRRAANIFILFADGESRIQNPLSVDLTMRVCIAFNREWIFHLYVTTTRDTSDHVGECTVSDLRSAEFAPLLQLIEGAGDII